MEFDLASPSANSTVNVCSGDKITISYSGAKNTYDTENVTGYISAIIKSGAYNSTDNNTSLCTATPLYYARLKAVDTEGNGSINIQIPDLEDDDYTLIIYNEIERGPYKTNYAKPKMITLSVLNTPPDTTVPTVNNIYRNTANTIFKFTAIDDINLGQIVTSSGDIKLLSGSSITTNILTNQPQTLIDVYDASGNITTKTISDMILDNKPPEIINITHNNSTYSITVSDNESGI
ncbi:MAG: hypothetical protein J6Y29_00370 [Clostridiales bacterium]|nr:hypothetical protein [Clostridiales bacterium]